MTPRLFLAWFLAFSWGALIWTVSSLPIHGKAFEVAAKNHLDWLVHAVEYGLFALFLIRALVETLGQARWRRAFLLATFVGSVFAVADEIHQATVPYRSASVEDAWADMAGIVILTALYKRKYLKQNA